jgi:serine/threonine-protein kinase RsbW
MLLRISLDLPDQAQSVPLCRRTLRFLLKELAVDQERSDDIELALSEATSNVIQHAYQHPGNRYLVHVELYPDRVLVRVEDHGSGFSRAAIPDPDREQLGGRGLWIIEQLADSVTMTTLADRGSVIEAEFRLPTPVIFEPPPPAAPEGEAAPGSPNGSPSA